MSNLSVQSNQVLHCIPQNDGSLKCHKPAEEAPQKQTLSDSIKDAINIDRGLTALGKGTLAGGLAGAATGAGLAATLSHNMLGVFGDYTVGSAAKLGGVVGGVIGAAAGAASANFVDNKAINATIGAVAGGVASGAIGGGWLLGGVAGAAGAIAGTMMIEK